MSQQMVIRIAGLSTAVVALSLPASALLAQASAQDSLPPVTLQPVVISVLRMPLPSRLVPYAVSVGGDSIWSRSQARLGLAESVMAIPGVEAQNRFNYAVGDRLSIRGMGARTQFGIRGVKVLVDGVPATLADGQTTLDHLDLASIDRIEVIRGPTSSLYGNASGGVVRIETGLPTAERFHQRVGALAGSNGLVRLKSSTAGRTGPTTFGLDLSHFSYGGFREHSEADRFSGTWHLQYRDRRDAVRVVGNYVHLDARNPGSLNDSLLTLDRTLANPFNVTQNTGKGVQQGLLGVSWNRTAGLGDIESSVYILRRDVDNPIPTRVIDLHRLAGGARVQLRRATPIAGGALTWSLGTELDLQRDDRRNFTNEQGETGSLTLDQNETVWDLGFFLHVVAPLTSRVHLLAGARYDRVSFHVADDFTSGGDPDDTGSRAMAAFSPSVGLALDVADAVRPYVNVTTSFETPTTTELVNRPDGSGGMNPDLDPQRAISIELGLSGSAGRFLSYQAALYRTRVSDELIPFEVATQPGRTFFRNAGSAIHRGLEIGVTAAPLPRVRARASYSYTDAQFDEFATDDGVFDGNQIPGVAPHRFRMALTYDDPAGWHLVADGDVAGEMPVDDANSEFAPNYVILNVRAGIRALHLGTWTLTPYVGVSNLLDRDYVSSVVVNAFGRRYFEPGPGRQLWFGSTLSLRR